MSGSRLDFAFFIKRARSLRVQAEILIKHVNTAIKSELNESPQSVPSEEGACASFRGKHKFLLAELQRFVCSEAQRGVCATWENLCDSVCAEIKASCSLRA